MKHLYKYYYSKVACKNISKHFAKKNLLNTQDNELNETNKFSDNNWSLPIGGSHSESEITRALGIVDCNVS